MKTLIRNIKDILIPPPIKTLYANKYVQIFSHPRSGTHFLEAFVGENFYKDEDLFLADVEWGHWANRKFNTSGNKYQKLFGSHLFPRKECAEIEFPSIYIYRDGRAVAYSIWNTDNFVHPDYKNLTFSEFLKLKLDWSGSPGHKSRKKYNIAQHWDHHVRGWLEYSKNNKNIVVVQYEELINNPLKVYHEIHNKLFNLFPILRDNDITIINKAVGLKPNEAKMNSWKKKFTDEDEFFFLSQLKDRNILAY